MWWQELTSSEARISGSPALSNGISMTVYPLPVSIGIAADQNGVCDGTTVTLLATAVNGGRFPSYLGQSMVSTIKAMNLILFMSEY